MSENRRIGAGNPLGGLREVVSFPVLMLQMIAGAAGLILVFISLMLIRFWNSCLEWWDAELIGS